MIVTKYVLREQVKYLVFLVADLDRKYKAEIPHACPIVFVFKGYSMKTEQMQKMLHDVLFRFFCNGIYCPVMSYDGQWAILISRMSKENH